MSLKIGGQKTSGKTSSTENQSTNQNTNQVTNQTSTSTPNVPDWIAEFTKNLTTKTGGLSDLDPSSLVAGASPLTTQAAAGAQNLSGSPWNFDMAADVTRGVAGAGPQTVESASLLDGLGKYMSSTTDALVDTTLKDFDVNSDKTRAQQTLDEAASSAFGDSGAALARGFTEGELARARASTDAGLRDFAFTRATGLSSQDADRRQSASAANASLAEQEQARKLAAAGQLANLSTSMDANNRANISTQAGLGDILRGIETEGNQAPFAQLQSVIDMLNGLGLGNFIGQTTTGSGTTTGTATGTSTGTSSGTSSGKTKASGLDISSADIAKILAGMG